MNENIGQCNCCNNTIINLGVGKINAYWLLGEKFVYHICSECWHRKYRQFIFLRMEGDLTKELENKYIH